uniref:RAWUL domain-containing protein n=1 Tax=Timema monikensis TaxID=170555 RepID=A0A7R9EBQ0_9NEOP|nr:unnamed protein product [Timema monikensis]
MRSLVAGDKRSARLIRQHWTERKTTGQGAYILSYVTFALLYNTMMDEDWESASSRSSESGYDNIECGPPVQKRYLQCPALVTISHLKQFLRMKFDLLPQHKYKSTIMATIGKASIARGNCAWFVSSGYLWSCLPLSPFDCPYPSLFQQQARATTVANSWLGMWHRCARGMAGRGGTRITPPFNSRQLIYSSGDETPRSIFPDDVMRVPVYSYLLYLGSEMCDQDGPTFRPTLQLTPGYTTYNIVPRHLARDYLPVCLHPSVIRKMEPVILDIHPELYWRYNQLYGRCKPASMAAWSPLVIDWTAVDGKIGA